MEEVKDIPGQIPSLALYPPKNIRDKLPTQEWQDLLETWLFCIEYRLRLRPEHFANFKLSQNASGLPFLFSYLHQYQQRSEPLTSGSREAKLHHQCYFLLKRLLLVTKVPYNCQSSDLFDLIGSGSIAFHAIADWKSTLKLVWKRAEAQVKSAIDAEKIAIIKSTSQDSALPHRFLRMSAIIKCLPEIAVVAVVGSDYLESIVESYNSYLDQVQRAVTETLYHGLRSLMTDHQKRTSLLLDVLFDLKTGFDRYLKTQSIQPTLLSSLLCTTPFLKHIKADGAVVSSKRGQLLVDSLTDIKQNVLHLHPEASLAQKKSMKAKGKARANSNHEMHMHRAEKLSQIHDLFRGLPTGYVLRLLDHYSDNVEAVIGGLLEPDSLPTNLRNADDSDNTVVAAVDNPPDLAPRSTPPLAPQRKNVFDGDEFDTLQISSTRIHRGRRDMTDKQTVEEHSRSKAAIIAALAAFDADDDERDDTYDVADVGGAVDNTVDTDERRVTEQTNRTEEILWKAWSTNPELFGRDSTTRLSKARRQLCSDTNMDNEQIEGWAIMLGRDPKTEEKLRSKYSVARSFQGNQRLIESTKWRADASLSDSQDEGGNQSDGRRVGQAGIRGARTWNRGRGRGGLASGPPDERATQIARKRKEQGRGRGGASHNRREGRAKKMGRGMGPSNPA